MIQKLVIKNKINKNIRDDKNIRNEQNIQHNLYMYPKFMRKIFNYRQTEKSRKKQNKT